MYTCMDTHTQAWTRGECQRSRVVHYAELFQNNQNNEFIPITVLGYIRNTEQILHSDESIHCNIAEVDQSDDISNKPLFQTLQPTDHFIPKEIALK